MATSIVTWFDRIPQPIRDFLESLVSAGILAAAGALFSVALDPSLTAKAALVLIAKAFVDAVIAAARHGLRRSPDGP